MPEGGGGGRGGGGIASSSLACRQSDTVTHGRKLGGTELRDGGEGGRCRCTGREGERERERRKQGNLFLAAQHHRK